MHRHALGWVEQAQASDSDSFQSVSVEAAFDVAGGCLAVPRVPNPAGS